MRPFSESVTYIQQKSQYLPYLYYNIYCTGGNFLVFRVGLHSCLRGLDKFDKFAFSEIIILESACLRCFAAFKPQILTFNLK